MEQLTASKRRIRRDRGEMKAAGRRFYHKDVSEGWRQLPWPELDTFEKYETFLEGLLKTPWLKVTANTHFPVRLLRSRPFYLFLTSDVISRNFALKILHPDQVEEEWVLFKLKYISK